MDKININLTQFIILIGLLLCLTGCATQCTPLPLPKTELNHLLHKNSIQKKQNKKNKQTAYVACHVVPTIQCNPLSLTDVTLISDETILSVNAGDTSRWLFQTIVSGTDTEPTTHLLIKPKVSDLHTNVIVATTKRTYYFNLVSNDKKTSIVSFVFYDPNKQASVTQVDRHYRIKNKSGWFRAKPAWTPTSVYHDSTHVYIPMPSLLSQQSAPIFYLLDENNCPEAVNYHLVNHVYIVGQLFKKGVLVKGVGRRQQKVLIEYTGNESIAGYQ